MRTTPRWMTIVIIIFVLPLFSEPWLIRHCPADDGASKILIQIFPFYMAFSGWLAFKAYPSRPYVSWILLAVMALSTAAIFLLVQS